MTGVPASLSRAEERALSALDEDALIADLVDLVRVPSVTGTAEESELQHRQAASLRELGADVDAWKFDLPALTAHPDFPGIEAERSEGYGVVASFGAPADAVAEMPALVLQGHVDVVPTGDLTRWRNGDPYSAEITGDGPNRVLHGRGACDMKAGVAANMAVARALKASGLRLERSLAVHTVVSEEDGGLGAFATMLRGHRGEAAVLTEPTSGRLVTANAGALTFQLEVPGLAAHGSTRLEGINAIDAFLPVYRAIQALETRRNTSVDPRFRENTLPYPISIGVLRAGDWASSVPDLLTAEGRFGVRLGEDPTLARAEFERAIAEACTADPWLREHPARVAWTGGQFASGQLDGAHPLIGEVSGAVAAVSGRTPEQGAAPYGSDLRLYAGLGGIPTLHYGPGDVRLAHAPREQVPIAEVIDVARALLLLAVRRCGAHL